MKIKLIIILIIISSGSSNSQTYDLKKQKLLDGYNYYNLNKSLTLSDDIEREVFADISSGSILHINGTTSIFAVDPLWNRIVFLKDGFDGFRAYGGYGYTEGKFYYPSDMDVLNDGKIWICDRNNNRISQLQYNQSAFTISHLLDTRIPNGLQPTRIRASDIDEELAFFIADNDLYILYGGNTYRFSTDINFVSQGMQGIDIGRVNSIDKIDNYLFVNSFTQKKIYVIVLNEGSFSGNLNILFQQYWTYNYSSEERIIDFAAHDGWPNHEIFFINGNSKLKKIIPNETYDIIDLNIEGNSSSTFSELRDISVEPNNKEIIISQQWRLDQGIRIYAIAPSIQEISHNYGQYINIHEINFSLPNQAYVTAELFWPGGTSKISTICSNVLYQSGGWKIVFDERDHWSGFLPYNSGYVVKITARSYYGDVTWAVTNQVTFTGGVTPLINDVYASASTILEGNSYYVYGNSNRTNYYPYPAYSQTWSITSSNYIQLGTVSPHSDSPMSQYPYKYKANYHPSYFTTLDPWKKATIYYDYVTLKLSYGGRNSSITEAFYVEHEEPVGCPILYCNDIPIANLLPQSETLKGFHTDRIALRNDFFGNKEHFTFSIKENSDDHSFFEDVSLIIRDIPENKYYVMASTGIPVIYKQQKTDPIAIKKTSFFANDSIVIDINSSNSVIGIHGYTIENSKKWEPIKERSFAVYDAGSMLKNQDDSVSLFIDAAWTRILPHEDVFVILPDSTDNLTDKIKIKFFQQFQLDSIVYYESEQFKTSSEIQEYRIDPNEISESETNVKYELEPQNDLNFSFDLPPLKEGYKRYGYVKVIGRYEKATALGIDNSIAIPKHYGLEQNYPNPFNPSSTIKFSIPKTSHVKIEVFNLVGQKVQTLANERMNPGTYEVILDGSNIASGVYIYRMVAGNFISTKKMILLK